MPSVSVLIKPASGQCNMRCKYCFYQDVTQKREEESYGIMTLETLEQVIKRVFEYATDQAAIAFQGGEPTLAGLDFFRTAIELQKRYNLRRIPVHNAIQTNGYVINKDWADFFAKNQFLVGLSLDGSKEIHDLHRLDASGKGTYQKVLRAAQLFDQYHVEYNILTVLTGQAARSIGKIYGFYQRNHLRYQQYIPCLDPLGEERGGQPYSLTPELYGEFLKKLFDLWYADVTKQNFVSIRYFENLVGMIRGYRPESCGMSGICTNQNVIEADGSIYPCDFYVLDRWKLGNVWEDSFAELAERGAFAEFITSSQTVDPECQQCQWFSLCRGGCRRDRGEDICGTILRKSYFCKSYQMFFPYAIQRLTQLARSLG